MNGIHLIMPMAGLGSRFEQVGYDVPKPLIKLYDRPFFYWAVQSVKSFNELKSLDFVVLQAHVEKNHIERIIHDYYPDARIHILSRVTEGAVITCMEGIRDIDDDDPVVFNDCDHLFKSDRFNRFCAQSHRDADGVLLTFSASENKYSFVQKNENGEVIRTAEKEAISNEAICGCYYFRNAELFLENARQYLKSCDYNEYYMSGVYNLLIQNQKRVISFGTEYHVPFGVPTEYEAAKKDRSYLELLL